MIGGIGSAPVSFGVYGHDEHLGVSPSSLLAAAAEAGYAGMELGPPGFFGTPAEAQQSFHACGLTIVGAYVPIHLSAAPDAVEAEMASMQRTLDELSFGSAAPGLAILADEGSPDLLRHPARSRDDRDLALDDEGWARLGDNLARALDLAATAGVATTFHPHISTYVESPWEVERLLNMCDIGLTIDTGHFKLAGADPVESLRRWGDRVNHVHLKDVREQILLRAKADERRDLDVWWADVSTALGDGDVDLVAFLERLLAMHYGGWLVVEQDRAP
ncbi:MAG: TIM barrel protein, partial [Chloroflexota bacterium]